MRKYQRNSFVHLKFHYLVFLKFFLDIYKFFELLEFI